MNGGAVPKQLMVKHEVFIFDSQSEQQAPHHCSPPFPCVLLHYRYTSVFQNPTHIRFDTAREHLVPGQLTCRLLKIEISIILLQQASNTTESLL